MWRMEENIKINMKYSMQYEIENINEEGVKETTTRSRSEKQEFSTKRENPAQKGVLKLTP